MKGDGKDSQLTCVFFVSHFFLQKLNDCKILGFFWKVLCSGRLVKWIYAPYHSCLLCTDLISWLLKKGT